jgi:hypothetical protein
MPFSKLHRVRFMWLAPGGFIAPHTDTSAHGLAAINVALTNPGGAMFRSRDHGVLPFEPGAAFLVDIGYEHSCVNLSDVPRVHMIVHFHEPIVPWAELVERSYRAQVAQRENWPRSVV